MENYSRDLLSFIGGGDEADRGEQQRSGPQTEEVELTLGLSLGGRLGQERRRRRRNGEGSSSSAAPIQEAAPAPPAPAPVRVNSVPPTADAEPGNKESSGGTSRAVVQVQPAATVQVGGFLLNVTGVQPAAQLPASFSTAAGSSSAGEGNIAGTSSLPAGGIDDALKKRKAVQALKRLEVKRRIERMNSSKVSVEGVGKNQDEMNAPAKEEKVENLSMKNKQTGGKSEVKISCDLSMKNEQTGGQLKVERMNQSNVRRRPSGLPPLYRPPVAKQGSSSMQGKPQMQNSALNGAPSAQGRILSSAAVPSSGGTNGVLQAGMAPAPSPALPVVAPAPSPAPAVVAPAPSPAPAVVAPAPSPALAVAAAGLGSGGGQQAASARTAARATRGFINVGGTGVMLPWVWTWMLPYAGRILQGILYSYSRADQVRIMCCCHGRLLSPAEFVEHAGGGQVANPLSHIMVYRPRM